MSTLLYGQLTRRAKETPQFAAADGTIETPDQKMATLTQALSALVPAEVLTIHAAILAYATVIVEDGTTEVTKPELLKWTLPILAAVTVALFLIGRLPKWESRDWGRILIPPLAFFTWTLLTGTSAATPWFAETDRGWLLLGGGVLGAIVIAAALRLTPKAP